MSGIIQDTYSYQERNLSVHSILGSLYQKKVIGKEQKDKINSQTTRQDKARVLLDHLENSGPKKLIEYCAILEQSAEEDGLGSHKCIAQTIRRALGGDCEKYLREVIEYLEFDEDALEDTCGNEGIQVIPHWFPQRSERTGSLKSPLFKQAFDLLWGMAERDPAEAQVAVVKILKKKTFPVDLRAALTQAGAGFSRESIPLLHRALELCKREDCQNQRLIECRIHWQLMWCNDKLGNEEERDEHLAEALCCADSISPDFSAAFIFAWSAYVEMCRNSGDVDRKVEKEMLNLLTKATDYIEQCSEMKRFAEALKLYKADWHLKVAKSYTRRNSVDAALIHDDSAKYYAQQFPNVPQGGDVEKVEEITTEVLKENNLGSVSQFGQYVCQLYLKFGQFSRAKKVLFLVGDPRLLRCIDTVQERWSSIGLVACQ